MTLRIQTEWLAYFIKTAEYLGIAQAARELDITPQALNQNLSKLEKCVGQTLFQRSKNKPLQLTPEGQQFYQKASQILQGLEQLTLTYSEAQQPFEAEPLVLGFNLEWATDLVAAMAWYIRAEYPQHPLEIRWLESAILRQGLENQQIQYALTDFSLTTAHLQSESLGPVRYLTTQAFPRNPVRCLVTADEVCEWVSTAAVCAHHEQALALALAGAGVLQAPEIMLRAELERGHLSECETLVSRASHPLYLMVKRSGSGLQGLQKLHGYLQSVLCGLT
jgi:LysR family glycine cleavage system transcriptional activator